MNINLFLREKVVETAKRILDFGLVTGTWGNISIRDNEVLHVTPSGVLYPQMRTSDVVTVDFNGNVVYGNLIPTSELPMHIAIYKNRKDVGAIIHFHGLYSSIISIIADEIPPLLEDIAMALGYPLKVSKYAFPGTEELSESVLEALGENNAVYIRNHGATAVGEDIEDAFLNAVLTEKAAQIYYFSSIATSENKNLKVHLVPQEHAEKLRKNYLEKYKLLKKNVK
ncbi:MAG: L-fuculose-phosphate aldolase [Thermotogaceae bacterium]|jgi:L-fuculose-phosphate aldolase|nr:L-fuculose-phosphate aldolase [Thermotogaceae bacterium]